jgi:diguanylate cyclase (GGDEF)-like protein
MSIGRFLSADILVPESGVSRRHATITVENDKVVVEDLGSSHGTFVNGKAIAGRRALHEGDRLQVGDAIGVLLMMDPEPVSHAEVSRFDAVTGLLDRRAFLIELRRAFLEAKQQGHPLSLTLVRIDRLNHFADRFGDDESALVLRRIAQQIHGAVESEDSMVARYDEEEFALLFVDASVADAGAVSDWVREHIPKLAVPSTQESWAGRVLVTCGSVDTIANPANSAAEFLDAATAALKQSVGSMRAMQ